MTSGVVTVGYGELLSGYVSFLPRDESHLAKSLPRAHSFMTITAITGVPTQQTSV